MARFGVWQYTSITLVGASMCSCCMGVFRGEIRIGFFGHTILVAKQLEEFGFVWMWHNMLGLFYSRAHPIIYSAAYIIAKQYRIVPDVSDLPYFVRASKVDRQH